MDGEEDTDNQCSIIQSPDYSFNQRFSYGKKVELLINTP